MKIWESEKYYQTISDKEDFSHPGFKRALEYCQNAQNILDMGCGDGSKLAKLGNKKTKRYGFEVSQKAIELGKKKFPNIIFIESIINEQFDIVTSFFVLEHTNSPEKIIQEMIRLLKVGGKMILLSPNFGAPNRASPNFTRSRTQKLLQGFINDFSMPKGLNWNKVTPKIYSMKEFQPDLDTTVEPYLGSLISYVAKQCVIIETNSFWQMETKNPKFLQKVFRFLGSIGLYPFKYWGPHLFLVAEKS